ncbi:hypothetical protein CTI12_AA347260 [Artemisia annua]|uniref:ATPase, F1/V1/A1 complex, alpha/beta subunit, Zinc knuckle CX2CX4HX4C n=1 Tax=Artemisia annua TaxID=35608 RepID=A0A2U1MSB1_ARTAN|nr:hypothetical protein CTI12_AA347260 [Artemisia annua]
MPIMMDTMTANMCHKGIGNLEFARVLVEMDAGKKLKKSIEIQYRDVCNNVKGSKKIQVVYDWKPPVCSHCKVFGHEIKQCKKVVVIENDAPKAATNVNGEKGKNVNYDKPCASDGQGNGRNYQNTGKNFNPKILSANARFHNGKAKRSVNEFKRQEYRKKTSE